MNPAAQSQPATDVAVTTYGDSALLVRVRTGEPAVWERLHGISNWLTANTPDGVEGIVATYDSILVEYDPYVASSATLVEMIRCVPTIVHSSAPRTHRVPAVYGGAYGPDLAEVAAEQNMTPQQFVDLHASTPWKVAFRGAPAGAPMLDNAPYELPVRRCAQPRVSVPAGSVAVAGLQSVIYPVDSPGGWRLIARTPLNVIDIQRDPHLLYQPGDLFHFLPITEAEAAAFRGRQLGRADA